MIDYPIENCTKYNLWFDVDFSRQRVYIHSDDDEFMPDKDMLVKPGEAFVLDLDVRCEGYDIQDRDGKRVID